MRAGGVDATGVEALARADWLTRLDRPVVISHYLSNTLDPGEAAVIQTALNEGVKLVCIDEVVGRRVARLSGLELTGSVGVLLKARQLGYAVDVPAALERMREQGIWLSDGVVRFALEHAG